MADQGAIGTSKLKTYAIVGGLSHSTIPGIFRTLYYTILAGGWDRNVSTVNPFNITKTRGSYTLAGIVTENNTILQNIMVRLYDRKTGHLVSSQLTSVYGSFIFRNLKLEASNYFVVAFDNLNNSPDYNALIFDLLTPV